MRKSLYRRHNQVFLGLLRRYREQGKFRQRDLAEHLGSVQATVSKAETGNRRLDVIELREWLVAMGVDFLEFMTELHEQLEASSQQLDSWRFFPSVDQSSDGMEPDSELPPGDGDSAALMVTPERFEAQAALLAGILRPAMRSALTREVVDALSEVERDQHQSRVMLRWISRLPSGTKDATTLLQPSEAEVSDHAREMAQLMLSNWVSLLGRSAPERTLQLLDAVRHNEPDLPNDVLAGCVAWPIPEREAKSLLLEYLRNWWMRDLLNEWALILWARKPP